jgi:hypothetical protein
MLSEFLQNFAGLGNIEDHVMHMPALFGESLESGARAMSSASFNYTEDRKVLLVRFQIPAANIAGSKVQRNIRAAVIGNGGHLRVKIRTYTESQSVGVERVLSLPVRVTQEGVETTSGDDGSIIIKLKIIGEKDNALDKEEVRMGDQQDGSLPGMLFSKLFLGGRHSANEYFPDGGMGRGNLGVESNQGDEQNTSDITDSVRNNPEVIACRRRYLGNGYRLLARQCICNAKTSDESRSLCYGSLLSSALRIARRLNMDDFATDAKHTAIDCAYQEAKSACLEAVTTKALRAVYGDVAAGEKRELPDRIREAIESEDNGPSVRPTTGSLAATVVTVIVVLVLTCFLCALGVFKFWRLLIGSRVVATNGIGPVRPRSPEGQLSGVLSQMAAIGSSAVNNGSPAVSNPPRVPSKNA